jgi:transcriptional regulator with PAS, ATPase and Fis domain
VVSEADQKYLRELVELVSQEVMTFHTEVTKRQERINELNSELGNRYSYHNMIGKSKSIQDLYQMLEKIKASESTVLVQGENGTGKELIAKAIHFNSSRKSNSFVTVNCSAFNENLLDSELFGHVRGSFTGAIKDKKGLFEAAHRGTLFLDEIGDMSLTMQVKLLRVLQQGTLTPVGSTEEKHVDVRVIAATNRDLKEMIEQGQFREDLYYRINVINLVVPPLRDRKEDIPILCDHFLARGCKEKAIPRKELSKRALEKIFDYPWPGNIRELENEIERLIVLAGDEMRIPAETLSPRIRDHGELSKVQGVRVAGKLKDALEELEKTMIREGLRRTHWNKSRLAKELGISRAGLIMKVEKYGLDKRKLARNGNESGEAA